MSRIVSMILGILVVLAMACNNSKPDNDNHRATQVRVISEPDDPYTVVEVNPTSEDSNKWRIAFYRSGSISSVKQIGPSGMNGLVVGFFEKGWISKFGNVVNGQPIGVWHFFSPEDGSLSNIDTIQNE